MPIMTSAHRNLENRRSFAARYVESMRTAAASERTEEADLQLGMSLTFVAGAINAGGFLAVGQYTSHMSGIFSSLADNLVLGAFDLVLIGLSAFLPFVAGAGCSAVLINWGRRQRQASAYALPLILEAILLMGFGGLGWLLHPSAAFVAVAIPLLCFIMGLQNATVTKISGARMRTTHVTGMVTDIGIEIGKLFYRNRGEHSPFVRADRDKLRLLALLLGSFFAGAVTGAVGFKYAGFLFSLPLSVLLLLLAGPSMCSYRRHT
jgi:uncharacterized membrane protein YoaK (UPF0700 family)